MNELLNDTSLTTADIANPDRRLPLTPRAARQEHAASADSDRVIAIVEPISTPDSAPANQSGPLFAEDELHNYRARWEQVQTSFVDEPRRAVENADSLVANVVTRIAEQFAAERERLEKQWDRGDSIDTEDLRQAFKRYRAFFDRLLAF